MRISHVPFSAALSADPRWTWVPNLTVRFRERHKPGEPRHRWAFATVVATASPRLDTSIDADPETSPEVPLILHLAGIEGLVDPANPERRLDPPTEILRVGLDEMELYPELDFPGTEGVLHRLLRDDGVKGLLRKVENGVVRWMDGNRVGEGPCDGFALAQLLVKRWDLEVDENWEKYR